jgi:hypothetical protein
MKINIFKYILLTLVFISIIFAYGCGILPPNIASITVSPSTIIVGSTAFLSCEAAVSSGKELTYTWSVNGGSLSSTTGKTVSWTAPATAGTYIAIVTVSDGYQSSSATINLVVVAADAPIINSLTASPSSVNVNATSTISCEATDPNGKTMTYTWSCNGGSLSSTTGKAVTWTAPSTVGTYKITVTVSDDAASTTSTLDIIVSSAPEITSLTALPITVVVDNTAILACEATDPAGKTLTYTWSANNGALSSSTGKNVSWTAPSSAGTSTITMVVSNGILSTTATLNINVIAADAPRISDLSAAPRSGSSGGIFTITCTATDPNSQPLTYAWSKDGGSLSSTSSNPVYWTAPTVTEDTTYKITVVVSNGTATSTGDVEIVVSP